MKSLPPVTTALRPPMTALADHGWIHCGVEQPTAETAVSDLVRFENSGDGAAGAACNVRK